MTTTIPITEQQMQAVVKVGRGIENVIVGSVAVPETLPGFAKIEVLATGICGTDVHVARDEYAYEAPVVIIPIGLDNALHVKPISLHVRLASGAERVGGTFARQDARLAPLRTVGLPITLCFQLSIFISSLSGWGNTMESYPSHSLVSRSV
jgi:hypothetical protein